MSLYKDCSEVQIRWVHIYLYLLQKLSKSHPEINIGKISIDELISASRNLSVKIMSLRLIEKIRTNNELLKSDLQYLKLISNSNIKSYKKIEIINNSYQFEKVLDRDFIEGLCNDEDKVINELSKGLSIIKSISIHLISSLDA